MFLFPSGGQNPVTVEQTDESVITTDLTTYNFASQALGVEDSSRKIVVVVGGNWTSSGGARSLSSVTINSVGATLEVAQQHATDTGYAIEMWRADVPSGTSVAVDAVWNSAMARCSLGVFSVIGAATAAYDTGKNESVSSGALADTLNIPANGIAIAGNATNGSATTGWTNLSEDYDAAVENDSVYSGASAAFTTLQTALTITATTSGGSRHRLVMASWGPS